MTTNIKQQFTFPVIIDKSQSLGVFLRLYHSDISMTGMPLESIDSVKERFTELIKNIIYHDGLMNLPANHLFSQTELTNLLTDKKTLSYITVNIHQNISIKEN